MISLRSKITQEVLTYYFLHEKAEIYLNELARKLNLDSGNLSRKLSELEKQGILKSKFQGKERFFSLNKNFPGYTGIKSYILKTLGIESQLKKIKELIPKLTQFTIYGSYAANKLESHSDIDILAIGDHNTLELQKQISTIQKKIDREINLHQMSINEFKKKKKTDPFLKSILIKPKIELIWKNLKINISKNFIFKKKI